MLPILHQLTSGLDIHGLLAVIRNNKTEFEECFVKSNSKLVLEDLLGITSTEFSENRSNKFEKEVDIYKYFTDFLQYCSDTFWAFPRLNSKF